ncbi:uncharacterized protein N7484_003310 [Penicillium longicatenatum]|uniref:uncharacterized protein n=1 Tax=Penicillium longicatenatum TaxID=1561947 RepID=UPI0025470D11|nr:uncharacterized protein N7484_003310 [Penicillium longicatenatum]KAJ5649587.1 hypothetical protein N7484_003310 [Penicillium longicatenatum]KAJ5672905.1 hypothetical protein N7507_002032 [Penicillium longicatenatum]
MLGSKTLLLAAAAIFQATQVAATNCQTILTDTSVFTGSSVIEHRSLVIYKNGNAVGYYKGNPYGGEWIDIDSELPYVFVWAAKSTGAGPEACRGKYAAQTSLTGKVSGSGLQKGSVCTIDFNC